MRQRWLLALSLFVALSFASQGRAGVATDANGDLVVADFPAGAVQRVDPGSGTKEVIATGGMLVDPFGVATDADDMLLVADPGAAGILRVDPTTGAQSILTSGALLQSPSGIAVVPVPEPTGALAKTAALAALVALARRRRGWQSTQS